MLAEHDFEANKTVRVELAGMLMNFFHHWNLSSEDQLALLGLSTTNRGALSRYRSGEPLSANRDLLERAGCLLSIHKSLVKCKPNIDNNGFYWKQS